MRKRLNSILTAAIFRSAVLTFAAFGLILVCLNGCAADPNANETNKLDYAEYLLEKSHSSETSTSDATQIPSDEITKQTIPDAAAHDETAPTFNLSVVPAYHGSPTAIINNDQPYFAPEGFLRDSFEEYAPLDELGRCGPAMALVGHETMPTGKRESISEIKPTGWQTPNPTYDFIVGDVLYNRCHLLALQLTGENANAQNLITGTRTMNAIAMQPLENQIGNYIDATGLHVLMRVTPVFEGENLVASGVLMEAQSVEDGGKGIRFCRWCYNVEPGVVIDYATGVNWADGDVAISEQDTSDEIARMYVLNTRSKKFHDPTCPGVATMSEQNRQLFTGTRSELIGQGYSPCGSCKP